MDKETAAFVRMFRPSCRHGYTGEDLERFFGANKGKEHTLWEQLAGQTGMICTGKECDKPHGPVSYVSDVHEWYEGRPASDW